MALLASQQGMKGKIVAFLNKDLTAGPDDGDQEATLSKVPRLPGWTDRDDPPGVQGGRVPHDP